MYKEGPLRILLIGEEGVGKTTLVLSLVSEEFSPKVPARAEEITIPADVTPERVSTEIVDFSTRTQTQDQLIEEIRCATVICIVYALNNEHSIEQLSNYWLPLVHSCLNAKGARTPIVVVGNKLDLITETRMERILPLMEQFSEIETCIECSAKTMRNLSETFWFAQKAVLYPTAPLYLVEKKELTPACIRALTRVFRICDTDNDGFLSDKELEAFQERCFAIPLTKQSLNDVKQLIRNSISAGVSFSGITLRGFLFLHLVFIRKGRHETTWAVLRQFGYDNQLRLSPEFLRPKLTVPPDCSTELSPFALKFVQMLFTKHDLDQDGCLNSVELDELLSTSPEVARLSCLEEIGSRVETDINGWLTRRGYLAHWVLTAYTDAQLAMEQLAYLGFTYLTGHCYLSGDTRFSGAASMPSDYNDQRYLSGTHGRLGEQESAGGRLPTPSSSSPCSSLRTEGEFLLRAISVCPERRVCYLHRHTPRTVFLCRVYGARKVGKTCLLQGLLGRSLRGRGGHGIGSVWGRTSRLVAATGLPVYGEARALIMQEVGFLEAERMSAQDALLTDVACLVYDVTDPDSFRYVADIYLNYYRGTHVPCLFVSAKSDQPQVMQNYRLDPQEMASKYRLPEPHPFCSLDVRPGTREAVRSSGCTQRPRRRSVDNQLHSETMPGVRPSERDPRSLEEMASSELQRNGSQPHLVDPASDVRTFDYGLGGSVPDNLFRKNRESRPVTPSYSTRSLAEHGRYTDRKLTSADFHPVYLELVTIANYPHMRGPQLATVDYTWKLTIAATILAGFGFVAFKIVKPHL